jgi:hypothetical protein
MPGRNSRIERALHKVQGSPEFEDQLAVMLGGRADEGAQMARARVRRVVSIGQGSVSEEAVAYRGARDIARILSIPSI